MCRTDSLPWCLCCGAQLRLKRGASWLGPDWRGMDTGSECALCRRNPYESGHAHAFLQSLRVVEAAGESRLVAEAGRSSRLQTK